METVCSISSGQKTKEKPTCIEVINLIMKGNYRFHKPKAAKLDKRNNKEENRLVDADYVKVLDYFHIIKPCTRLHQR